MIAAICLFLIVLTVGAFWQLKDNAFINYDDNERDELDDAIYQFQQAIRARPDYDEPYHNLGLAYYKQGKIREARETFETAFKKNPDNAGAKEMLNSSEGCCPLGVRP